jgi:hypothetical protein
MGGDGRRVSAGLVSSIQATENESTYITLLDTKGLEYIGDSAYFLEELVVREFDVSVGFVCFPDDGGLR